MEGSDACTDIKSLEDKVPMVWLVTPKPLLDVFGE
jgi:hypothetical protein